jgi:hypothetical protein
VDPGPFRWPTVPDPWKGWQENVPGVERRVPYFGAGHYGIVRLDLRVFPDRLGMTSFDWIASRYDKAPDATVRWWRRFGRGFTKVATRVPRSGPLDGRFPEVWALPKAVQAIKDGIKRETNPLGMGSLE